MKRKVCVVVTARPSYSRIKTALRAINEHPDLELQLVVAASALLDRYGNAVETIKRDGFEIAGRVFMVLEGETLLTSAKTAGLGIVELATAFDNLRPDVVVTIADRYETIATAIAAAYMNIPLAHVQGGEITGSIDEKCGTALPNWPTCTSFAPRRLPRTSSRQVRYYVSAVGRRLRRYGSALLHAANSSNSARQGP
jgi:UDP-N-acetylglucosamine 2-epimerase